MRGSIFIGLDVHRATISVAVAQEERGGEVRHRGTVPHRPDHVRKLVEALGADGSRLHLFYEAGPCGYGLHRQLVEMGHDCIVVAPSLIPVTAGNRVKTDRRDAVMLAKLRRAGELTAVWVPDAAHEEMPDLVRARATAMRVPGQGAAAFAGFSAAPWAHLSGQDGVDGRLQAMADDGAPSASRAAGRVPGLRRRRDRRRSAGREADRADCSSPAELVPGAGGRTRA